MDLTSCNLSRSGFLDFKATCNLTTSTTRTQLGKDPIFSSFLRYITHVILGKAMISKFDKSFTVNDDVLAFGACVRDEI